VISRNALLSRDGDNIAFISSHLYHSCVLYGNVFFRSAHCIVSTVKRECQVSRASCTSTSPTVCRAVRYYRSNVQRNCSPVTS
jgi:hypothetical protein